MPAFYYSIGARYYKCERFTITMEVSCMKTQRRTADEQYQLIMECRSSGLSDYQWCTEHNINPGTFYNWVKRLRKKACYDIPPATGRGDYKRKRQIMRQSLNSTPPVMGGAASGIRPEDYLTMA